ncbi:MAG: NAD-dependent succinate-semialdehyde dehydrogenase [Actinomycetia bacterium]|nr:NAD-dependent succinate-semialdehyde dehydrogenase [Actinomycetes bacterium]
MALSSDEGRVVAAVRTDLFLGGVWQPSASGRTLPVDDPATGEAIAEVADATPEEGLEALRIAAEHQAAWARTAPRERGEILRRAFEIMTTRADDLALLMTLEMGKPVAESLGEVRYAAEFFRWFSEESVRVDGRFGLAPAGDSHLMVLRQPVGPCLFITPWNFPLAMGTRKIGPAVAAGCTMVVKPAKQTPLSMLALAGILAEAGLPEGVLSVLTTRSASGLTAPMIKDARLRKVSFTGSTEIGRMLVKDAADQLLRTSMELGGNAPFLVFADADLDAAVEGAMIAKMRNMGEACTAANRFHVHASVADEFADRLAARMAALKVGRGTEPGVQVGPLIDDAGREKVEDLVADAADRGAALLVGGSRLAGRGFFYAPTVLGGVERGARILTEEVFGPVAPVTTFETDDEAIEAANATEFGLVSYAFTQSWARGMRLIEELQAGMVGLNRGLVSNPAAPFGGIKQSGFGREGGPEGIHEYLDVKYVSTPR